MYTQKYTHEGSTVITLKIRQTSFGKLNFPVENLEENCHLPVYIIYFWRIWRYIDKAERHAKHNDKMR